MAISDKPNLENRIAGWINVVAVSTLTAAAILGFMWMTIEGYRRSSAAFHALPWTTRHEFLLFPQSLPPLIILVGLSLRYGASLVKRLLRLADQAK